MNAVTYAEQVVSDASSGGAWDRRGHGGATQNPHVRKTWDLPFSCPELLLAISPSKCPTGRPLPHHPASQGPDQQTLYGLCFVTRPPFPPSATLLSLPGWHWVLSGGPSLAQGSGPQGGGGRAAAEGRGGCGVESQRGPVPAPHEAGVLLSSGLKQRDLGPAGGPPGLSWLLRGSFLSWEEG